MKKIQYISPSIKVANVELQGILAGSDSEMGINSQSVDEALSKGGSFGDEED